jgi:hypothetical protein
VCVFSGVRARSRVCEVGTVCVCVCMSEVGTARARVCV